MSKINKIRLSGTDYDIQDVSATSVVELTQAEYDDLPASAKTDNILYIITDAQAGDLTNYYTKTETDNAITAATSTKQDQLVSGTNIKTINNESILGEGNIDIQGGGGGTVESVITSGSTNAVESKAIWSATTFNKSVLLTFNGVYSTNYPNGCTKLNVEVVGNDVSTMTFYNDDQNLGKITITHFGSIAVYNSFNGASYEISGTTVLITYPTVTSVTKISMDNGKYVYTAVVEGAWVNENTYMKPEVDSIATSLQNNINSKQDTLVSGTNIKTINNESILGSGNIDIQGGGSSYTAGDGIDITNNVISVTGKVDTSAITTSVTSSSTDAQVPSAKAVYTAIPIVTNTITSGSTEVITSGAVYDAIGDIETLLSQI